MKKRMSNFIENNFVFSCVISGLLINRVRICLKRIGRTMKRGHIKAILFLLFLLFLNRCTRYSGEKPYFPETGEKAIKQRAVELKSNLKVLSIALEPGFEDLATLAYFRLECGATILSGYFTNGEAGESDIEGEYPNYLAATRRKEAGDVLNYLDGDVYFLNLPHIVATRDSLNVREKWPKDSVETKLIALIDEFQPDILLIERDWRTNNGSVYWSVFKEDVISTVAKMGGPKDEAGCTQHWRVGRIIVGDDKEGGNVFPIDRKNRLFGKTTREIGSEAAEKYRSAFIQRKKWMEGKERRYSVVSDRTVKNLDSDLPRRNTRRLLSMEKKITDFSNQALQGRRRASKKQLGALIDSINVMIYQRSEYPLIDQRAISYWKNGLERLRCSLLGVTAEISVSEDILCIRQLTHITVDKIRGMDNKGNTQIFFGGLDDSWVVNEWTNKSLPYRKGEIYRLLTPLKLDITVPQALYGLQQARLNKPVYIFIIHDAERKEESFNYRKTIRLKFAPKFTTEVMTPVVRMISGEKLMVRLTNHSRDGVRDTLKVKDRLAESTLFRFRLNQKEATDLDTLTLEWKGKRKDGTYMLPVDIDGIEVGKFIARKFEARIDTNKRVGYIAGMPNSTMEATLRRLGTRNSEVNINGDVSGQLKNVDVLIVDRRAVTLKKKIEDQKGHFDGFVENGGHLIYLAQDAEEWNRSKMWEEIELIPTHQFDESYPVETDGAHPFISSPNLIGPEDWYGWLYLRAYNIVKMDDAAGFSIPVKTKGEEVPLLLTKKRGEGRLTYVDLALEPQLLNIHEGMFRLFANIVSI